MTVWQIAAGDGTRDYTEIFLKFGVILVGPGSEGNYFDHKKEYNNPNSWSFRTFLRPMAEELQEGDLVVLKRPDGRKWEIVAVGEVTSEYTHRDVFEDVDGWDLQHCRMVTWKTPTKPLSVTGLRRGTLVRVNNSTAVNAARKVWSAGAPVVNQPIPPEPIEITVDQVIDSLIAEGLPSNTAERITTTVWRLRRIANWYSDNGAQVGEHEIRTFLIVPLLTSLGWAEQKIKIEWNNIDIAIFNKPYSETSKPLIIIESKRLYDGLRYAPEQAQGYTENYPTCKYFVVSDGIRYKLYRRTANQWRFSAYMNLLTLRDDYPYDKSVQGAGGFFLQLLPRGAI